MIYQNQLKVSEYFWFDPVNPDDWAGFRLSGGNYEALLLENEHFVSQQLGLALVRWQGIYKGVDVGLPQLAIYCYSLKKRKLNVLNEQNNELNR